MSIKMPNRIMGDRGFEKADSRNLLRVNSEMVREFIRNDSTFDAEDVRAVKTHKWIYFNHFNL